VKTRFLIGADGANSKVATDLGLDSNREWIVGVEDVYDLPLTEAPRLHCFLEPELAPGYLAWVAHDGEQAHVGVGGYATLFDPQQALKTFRNSLSGVIDLDQAKLVERRGGQIPVGGVLRNVANRNGLLVGDAAGAVSPLTAGGLDPCMRLSTYAARVIFEYLNTQDAELLKTYSGNVFRTRFISRIWMRRFLNGLRQRQAYEALFRIMRLPPFIHLARHIFFGRGSFPDLEVHTACPPEIWCSWSRG
jgi:flavin-dependent dehydrogenase